MRPMLDEMQAWCTQLMLIIWRHDDDDDDDDDDDGDDDDDDDDDDDVHHHMIKVWEWRPVAHPQVLFKEGNQDFAELCIGRVT